MRRSLWPLGLVSLASVLAAPQGQAQSVTDARLFQKLAGSWSGTGTVTLAERADERIRCRADYSPSSPSQLRLVLRCASDSFNLQVGSDVSREADRITGTWTETTTGVSGNLNGTVSTDRIDATTAALGVSARLSVMVRGNTQTVQLSSQGQVASTTAVTLRRQ